MNKFNKIIQWLLKLWPFKKAGNKKDYVITWSGKPKPVKKPAKKRNRKK